jgi:hypothetical protein
MNKFATAFRLCLGILVLAMSGAAADTLASKENKLVTGGSAGAAGTAAGFNGPFECSMVAGLLITQEWYTAGFEKGGVDGTKWQGRFMCYGYVDAWAL